MPRKRQPDTNPQEVQELNLPVPFSSGKFKEHEHRVDPYRTLPGAVPAQSELPKRKRGRPRSSDVESRALAEGQRLTAKYDCYLDAMRATGGDITVSLATVYNISVEEAYERRGELINDLNANIPQSSTGQILNRLGINRLARLSVLKNHVYSGNPAASLKAIQMVGEEEGSGPDVSSYEQYVRRAIED